MRRTLQIKTYRSDAFTSAFGTRRTSQLRLGMSALAGKADIHRRRDFYVEMMCEFHRAERTIERDGGVILQVRLHEDYIRTLAGSDLFQRIDRSSSDTLAPMSVRDGEIVDIDLAPLLLKFLQYAYAARPPTTVFSTIAT